MHVYTDFVIQVELKILPHALDLYTVKSEEQRPAMSCLGYEQWLDPNALPKHATAQSAGIDLIAAEDVRIPPERCIQVRTGLCMNIGTPNIVALVFPRSGLGAKQGVILGNSVAVIDNDYHGELLCYVWNRNPYVNDSDANVRYIKRGERFAQMVFVPHYTVQFKPVGEFSRTTERGEGGFGSTGR